MGLLVWAFFLDQHYMEPRQCDIMAFVTLLSRFRMEIQKMSWQEACSGSASSFTAQIRSHFTHFERNAQFHSVVIFAQFKIKKAKLLLYIFQYVNATVLPRTVSKYQWNLCFLVFVSALYLKVARTVTQSNLCFIEQKIRLSWEF